MQKLPFTLKVGDYCTAYQKGIHKVVHILFPPQGRASTALVTLERILDSNCNPSNRVKSTCDVAWCRKIDKKQFLEERKNSHASQIKNIEEYILDE